MAGAYCRYCGRRCFVYRIVPGHPMITHRATCPNGMAHDRRVVGHDHSTAINPADSVHKSVKAAVLTLHDDGQLGYLRVSDEWADAHGEPLTEEWQQVAQELLDNGQLPEFARHREQEATR